MEFWKYLLHAEALCLGERVKGGLFRPCDTRTIRYSTLTGALSSYLGRDVSGAGYFCEQTGRNIVSYLTYAPRDDATGVSLVPLTIQYLANAYGVVVIRTPAPLPKTFELTMGALKSKGIGHCRFECAGLADMEITQGTLRTRIPCHRMAEFSITEALVPIYGYLFEPTSITEGEYVRSLWDGSQVVGPKCLVKEEVE